MATTTLASRDVNIRAANTESVLPPRVTSNQPSGTTYAVFTVLGLMLLVMPIVCAIAACIGKLRYRNKNNAPAVETVGENGRTAFKAATYEEQGLRPPTDPGPILPMAVRTPPHIARLGARDDEAEYRSHLPQGSRYMKPSGAPSHACPAHVSPVSPQESLYTLDVRDDGAISPVSMIGDRYHEVRPESMAAVLHQKNPYATEPSAADLANIPLTPPVNASFRPHDLRPRTPSGQAFTMRAYGAETSGSIASTVVDANFKRVPKIQLSQVPKRR